MSGKYVRASMAAPPFMPSMRLLSKDTQHVVVTAQVTAARMHFAMKDPNKQLSTLQRSVSYQMGLAKAPKVSKFTSISLQGQHSSKALAKWKPRKSEGPAAHMNPHVAIFDPNRLYPTRSTRLRHSGWPRTWQNQAGREWPHILCLTGSWRSCPHKNM